MSNLDELPPLVWRPRSWAQDLYLSLNHVTELLAEGNRYGGKSDALFWSYGQHCEKGYGAAWRGVMFRRTHKQLADIIDRTRYWFDPIFAGRAVYNSSSSEWTWDTGEKLLFRYMDTDNDFSQYKGSAFAWIGWEELTLWPNDKCYRAMLTCLRSTYDGIPLQCRATTNPGDLGHCVPYGEVLTPHGWVDIKDVQEGDDVYSVTPDRRMVVKKVEQKHEQRYTGKMMAVGHLKVKSKADRMVFTPNHNLPLLNVAGDTIEMRPYVNLPGQANIARSAIWESGTRLDRFAPEKVKTGRRKHAQPESISGDDFAELSGWMITEGYTIERDKMFGIAQSKPQHRQTIELLLQRCGFKYSKCDTSFTCYAPDWWAFFRTFGTSCNRKALPRWLLGLCREQLEIFYAAAMAGDGCEKILYTQSKALADQYEEIAIKIGMRVYTGSRQRLNRDHRCYEVSATRNKTGSTWIETGQNVYDVNRPKQSRTNVRSYDFDGMVYCLGVPDTHAFVIKQNGYVWISGNSWVRNRFRLPERRNKVIRYRSVDPKTKKEIITTRGSVFFDYRANQKVMETDPDYVVRSVLPGARNEAERRAWADGDWDIPAGGLFDEAWYLAGKHCVLPSWEPAATPEDWRIFRAYDHGDSAPFSVGWWAKSDGSDLNVTARYAGSPAVVNFKMSTVPGDLFRLGEWYGWSGQPNEGLKLLYSKISLGIIQQEVDWKIADRVQPGPADDSIFDTANGQSVSLDLAKNVEVDGRLYTGARFIKAGKGKGSRVRGWNRMRELMMGAIRNGYAKREKPGLFVLDRCDQFLRTIPQLARSKTDPNDADTEGEDHIADESRYVCLGSGSTVVGVPRTN